MPEARWTFVVCVCVCVCVSVLLSIHSSVHKLACIIQKHCLGCSPEPSFEISLQILTLLGNHPLNSDPFSKCPSHFLIALWKFPSSILLLFRNPPSQFLAILGPLIQLLHILHFGRAVCHLWCKLVLIHLKFWVQKSKILSFLNHVFRMLFCRVFESLDCVVKV